MVTIIASQPVSVYTNVGQPASFSVSAIGTSPLFQWRKDGIPIENAYLDNYSLIADCTNAGSYDVVVSNYNGAAWPAELPAPMRWTSSPWVALASLRAPGTA